MLASQIILVADLPTIIIVVVQQEKSPAALDVLDGSNICGEKITCSQTSIHL